MIVTTNPRNFEELWHESYPPPASSSTERRVVLAAASSAVGTYEDSMDRPGSSYLWIGLHHHLDRGEVQAFVRYLQRWVDTGHLSIGEGGGE